MSENSQPPDPRPVREPVFNPKAFEAAPVVALLVAMMAIHGWISWAGIREANAVYTGYAFVSTEFWRAEKLYSLVSHAMLHGNWMHLGFNSVAFFALGSACWKLMGTARFFVFFALTAAAGAALFALLRPGETVVLVGASGVIFGLIAAIKRVDYRIRALRGQDVRMAIIRFIGIIIAVNLVIGFFPFDDGSGLAGTSIAWEAHVGGFLLGWFVTPWMVRFWPA